MRGLNRQLALVGAVALVIGSGLVATASASTKSESWDATSKVSDLLSGFDISDGLTFPKFDRTKGTLTKVTLSFSGDMDTRATFVANTNCTNVSTEAKLFMWVQDLGNNFKAGTPAATATKSNPQILLLGTQDLGDVVVGTPTVAPWLTVAGTSGSLDYTSTAILTEFQSLTPSVIALRTQTFARIGSFYDGGGNGSATQETKATLNGTVTYTYSLASVPEATTLLLGGMAVMPLLMHRRRRPEQTPAC